MSSFAHVYIKGKDILIIGVGPTQGLDDTTLTTEAKFPINFTQSGKRFVSSLHYNGNNSLLFGNAIKVYQFKGKFSEKKIMHCDYAIFEKTLQLTIRKKNRMERSCEIFFC